jgi:hypothetical protein
MNKTNKEGKSKVVKITFEMAKDMGLLPKMTKRYFGWFPFMSAYGVEVRDREQENSFRSELNVIREDYCDNKMLVSVILNEDGFPICAIKNPNPTQ